MLGVTVAFYHRNLRFWISKFKKKSEPGGDPPTPLFRYAEHVLFVKTKTFKTSLYPMHSPRVRMSQLLQ